MNKLSLYLILSMVAIMFIFTSCGGNLSGEAVNPYDLATNNGYNFAEWRCYENNITPHYYDSRTCQSYDKLNQMAEDFCMGSCVYVDGLEFYNVSNICASNTTAQNYGVAYKQVSIKCVGDDYPVSNVEQVCKTEDQWYQEAYEKCKVLKCGIFSFKVKGECNTRNIKPVSQLK